MTRRIVQGRGADASRRPLRGTLQILRYNWPFYVVGLAACLLGGAALELLRLPDGLRQLGLLGIALALYWLAASVLVSWWVYDASPLYRWDWLLQVFPEHPERWANIHCGLDESSPALQQLFGGHGLIFDIYDDAVMGEPSIRRARAEVAARPASQLPAQPVDFRNLPVGDGQLDAVFLFLAAHEIRDAAGREQFFDEVRRVLRPGGRVVIAEHLRDTANFAAFGPGFWHFLPRREWLRLARGAHFHSSEESRITPFVRVFVLCAEE